MVAPMYESGRNHGSIMYDQKTASTQYVARWLEVVHCNVAILYTRCP